jgi:hypothetical protein
MNKYRAKRTEVDGVWFDSKLEATVYQQLKVRERDQKIAQLELQPKFPLVIDGIKVTPRPYRADFRYLDIDDQKTHIIDVKGVDTREGKLRRRLAEILHGVIVEVVKKPTAKTRGLK